MSRDGLGGFEIEVLCGVAQQSGRAYGITISNAISEATGRPVSLGAVYTTLERLERKGFISSVWGEPTPERGGRRKRYYSVEAKGALAISRAASRQLPIWGELLPAEI